MSLRSIPASARKLPRVVFFAACIGAFAVAGLSARPAGHGYEPWPRGDALVAERFVVWAENAIEAGQMAQAQATLERANDFADVSSDVSYLLAWVRSANGESRLLVIEALEKAISVNQWRRYSEAQARLLQAEYLVALRRFDAALDALEIYRTLASETVDSSLLRLQALKGLALAGAPFPVASVQMPFGIDSPVAVEFRQRMLETMDRDPRDPRPLRILFAYAGARVPNENDRALLEVALRRLPFLLDADPALAWMAAPFVGDLEEARRLVLAYRAGSFGPVSPDFSPNPTSIAPALYLGLLDDMDAVEEFFAPSPLVRDRDLLIAVGDLLRSDEGRDRFAEKLHSFTGAITTDENRDGIPETRAVFQDGVLRAFYYDAGQTGVADWRIVFDTGLPQLGEVLAMPDLSLWGDSPARATVVWDRYPFVRQVTLGAETFFFAPGDFHYSPIRFLNIGASETYEGLLLPARNHLSQGLTRRALGMSAVAVERPCLEFEKGVERVHLRQGMPLLSEVVANGMLVSVTEFENGFPLVQRVDLLRGGRMDTIRHFRTGTGVLESSASDWRGDGSFDYVELYP